MITEYHNSIQHTSLGAETRLGQLLNRWHEAVTLRVH
jgi:hypothetical protein